MTRARFLLLACAWVAGAALAQAPAPAPKPAPKPAPAQAPATAPKAAPEGAGFVPFRGKLKEGNYEIKSDYDMSSVPGVPKEAQKGSEAKQRCLNKAELERGINAGSGCKVASAKESGNQANVRMECQDGSVTELNITLNPNGYVSEMKTTGKQDGKAFTTLFRSQSRYLGPCPAAK